MRKKKHNYKGIKCPALTAFRTLYSQISCWAGLIQNITKRTEIKTEKRDANTSTVLYIRFNTKTNDDK